MRAGFALRTQVEGLSVGVIYTSHFVERFETDLPTRPAAKRTLDEDRAQALILEALPSIAGWFSAGYSPDGLIRSRASKVNMTFSVKQKAQGGFTLVMKNVMVKEGYEPSSRRDYVVDVNPRYTIHFLRKMDRDLKLAVVDDLRAQFTELEPEGTYDLETQECKYTVDLGSESDFYIEDAEWLEDMTLVDVR